MGLHSTIADMRLELTQLGDENRMLRGVADEEALPYRRRSQSDEPFAAIPGDVTL